jgi:hypothetical protein
MSDAEKKIDVHYKADHDPKVWFSPGSGNVELKEAGKITFKKADDSSDFSFSSITITPTSDDFSVDSLQSHKLIISDSHADLGTYEYCINITTADGPVSSDPQIINKAQ